MTNYEESLIERILLMTNYEESLKKLYAYIKARETFLKSFKNVEQPSTNTLDKLIALAAADFINAYKASKKPAKIDDDIDDDD